MNPDWHCPRLTPGGWPAINSRGDVDLLHPLLPSTSWDPEWRSAFAASDDLEAELEPLGAGACFDGGD